LYLLQKITLLTVLLVSKESCLDEARHSPHCSVDAAVQMLDIIWEAPLSRSLAFVCEETPSAANLVHDDIIRSANCKVGQLNPQQTIPLELFVRETLRRSRTSCSTLQAALLFCKRAGGEVIRRRAQQEGVVLTADQLAKLPGAASFYPSLSSNATQSPNDYLLCNRRTFLASVMISSKFLQDRTFSNRAWSKISGLTVQELSRVERRVLMALEFNLNVCEVTWTNWTNFLKLQWKAGRPITRCGMPHTNSLSAVQATTIRSALARTSSLPEGPGAFEGEVLDADVSLPSGDQHAFFANNANLLLTSSPLPSDETSSTGQSTPLSKSKDADMSTPTLPAKGSVGGDSTPTSTLAPPRKSGQSLLSTALLNHHFQVCS
jgi:hypothetical protein